MTIKDPAEILKMSDEELVQLYVETRQEEEDVAAQKLAVKQELIERLKKENRDGKEIGEYSVTRFKMVTFKTSLEEAKKHGAVKVEEKPDLILLRKLYDNGVKIEGAGEREELRVSLIEKEEEK